MKPKRFSELREKANLTQPELAELMNLSLRAIASWESGERKPPIDKLEWLADFYHVDTDYILGRTDVRTKEQPSESIGELRKEIIPLLEGLSDSDLQRVGDFVAGLKAARAGAAAAPDPDRPMQK